MSQGRALPPRRTPRRPRPAWRGRVVPPTMPGPGEDAGVPTPRAGAVRVPPPRHQPGHQPGRQPGGQPGQRPRTVGEAWAARTHHPPVAARRVGPPGRMPARVPELPAHLRRRRRVAAAVLAALVGVVAVGLGGRALLYDADLADVEAVTVTGLHIVAAPDVVAAAGVPPGVPLAAVDLAAVEQRVERIPAVADALVERDWPHTLTVAVVERVPVAVADTPQGPRLVDRTGLGYAPVPARTVLPRLVLPRVDPADPATRAALDVLAGLPDGLRKQVRTIEVEPPRYVSLHLTRDREVRWGPPERVAEKAAVLGPLLSQSGRVYDVASPELPTIRR